MLVTALRQARGTAGRLAAAGVAVVLGTAFVAAVLLASGLLQRTASDAVSAAYAGADVVVTPTGQALDEAVVARVRALPGVAGADGRIDSGIQLSSGGRTEYAPLTNAPSVPALRPRDLDAGALPSAPGQVAMSRTLADRLHVAVGGQLLVRTYVAAPGAGPEDPLVTRDVPVRVSGVLAGGADSALGAAGTVVATTSDALAWSAGTDPGGVAYGSVLAVARAGTSPEQLRAAVAQARVAPGAVVQTADQRSAEAVDRATGGTRVLTGVVLAFAVLALFVAGIVIMNTFAVLVAQRTRQLALLRCVGATSGQVRRSVLAEALALGLVASLVGVAVGTGLAAAAAAVLARAGTGIPVPGTVTPTPTTVAVPVLLGVLATVLAAVGPARAATRVAPLAALRPADAPDLRTRTSRLRLAVAAVLVLGGAAALAGGVLLAHGGSSSGVVVALAGGALSFLGVMVGAVLVVPRTVGAIGRLAAVAGGGPARVAAANAVRNPRRTATTTSALLIGVTLVTLMTVGAASTERTLGAALDQHYPVDVAVGADSPGPQDPATTGAGAAPDSALPAALPASLPDRLSRVPGVADVVPLEAALATASGADGDRQVTVRGVDPRRGRRVVADAGALGPLAAGVAVVPAGIAEVLGVTDGQRLRLAVAGADRALTARVTSLPGDAVVVTAADLAALAPAAPTTRLWVDLVPGADAGAVVDGVREVVGQGGDEGVPVQGSAVERAGYERVIDTMLLVVVALLGVAVVIALIGVANTLSLSVIERTRESAVLRALGLTRGQLRGMLALEGALVAGVGGLLGVVLGTVYGWAGAASLLGDAAGDGWARLALPWARVGLVLAVAVAAGLLASVLPGRRAARTPPVAALAE